MMSEGIFSGTVGTKTMRLQGRQSMKRRTTVFYLEV